MFLNADIPPIYCDLRAEYIYDMRRGHGEFIPVCVFGVASIPGRAVLFHAMTDTGAQLARLPISAFVHKRDAPVRPLEHLELWDCFSHDIAVTEFELLGGLRVTAILKNRDRADGRYLFTLDWTNSAVADAPGEGGHKNAHVLQLDEGNYAALPNHRIAWYEASFVTKPFGSTGKHPDFLTNTHIWTAETSTKWVTEDSDRQFYDVEGLARPCAETPGPEPPVSRAEAGRPRQQQ